MPLALVTGGSRGLGRALARTLVDDGWEVVVTGRDPARLEQAARALGPAATAVPGDVTDPDHRAELVRLVAGRRLDLLVNNASGLGPSPLPSLVDLDPAAFAELLRTNVVAPVALVAALRPSLGTDGVVVDVTSDAAVEAWSGWGAYGSSKAALDHASAVLAVEEQDLRVYAVDPGDLRTDMHQAAFPDQDITDRALPSTVTPALLALVRSGRPSGRYRLAAGTSDLR